MRVFYYYLFMEIFCSLKFHIKSNKTMQTTVKTIEQKKVRVRNKIKILKR
jgi:hypothetical protein